MDEFIDAYSDDQIFLERLDELIESHPREGSTPDAIKYSTCCRLWATMAIGSIEMMIKKWNTGDEAWSDVYQWFSTTNNIDKIAGLKAAIARRGLSVSEESFADLTAIKYIRNAYVHGDWTSSQQQQYVIVRGFPGNMMHFNQEHFWRMRKAYGEIMNALGMMNALSGVFHQT